MILKNHKKLTKEIPAAENIPYRNHVTENIIKTYNGYLMVFKLSGVSFQNTDDEDLNIWHERLNVFYRNIAQTNISIWHTIIRRIADKDSSGEFQPGFAHDLNEKYTARVAKETLRVNELYLSIIYRPQPSAIGAAAMRILGNKDKKTLEEEQRDAIDECNKLQQQVKASLSRYDPEILGIYQQNGYWFSAPLEFLASLINSETQRVGLPRAPLNEVLTTSRLLFGVEAMEYRTPTQNRISAILGVEYGTPTTVGQLNVLLAAPFSFVMTQSATFIDKATALSLMQRQKIKMLNVGDMALSQADELDEAMDEIASGKLVMVNHHLTLQIQSELFDPIDNDHQKHLRQLNNNIAKAQAIFADTGMKLIREDLANEAAFWAQLPGNFAFCPRLSPITSRNFAALAPFHTYPTGRATGNHWGDAMAVLVSEAKSKYYLSLHASDPREPDGGSKKDVGHTFIAGEVGSGKTVFIGFMICMLQKQDVTQVIFDKDYGLEILIRALGGCYLPLKNKQPTGFNPLKLEPNAINTEFMGQWLLRLAYREDMPYTERQRKDLAAALKGTLSLDYQYRRLSRLIEFLDVRDPEGIYARLGKWCASTHGEYAWVFDNEDDSLVPIIRSNSTIGFDVTEYIDNDVTRAPITMYLFHLTRSLLDGRRLVCWMDEFWKMLDDPAFKEFSKDGLKTWRKQNGLMALCTQETGDATKSEIASTLVEQTPTKILFPNGQANPEEYINKMHLSEREYLLIKQELLPGSRQFLVKQNNSSVVCELDLKGLDFELDVISGRTHNVKIAREIIREVGDNPADWLPLFEQRRGKPKPGAKNET